MRTPKTDRQKYLEASRKLKLTQRKLRDAQNTIQTTKDRLVGLRMYLSGLLASEEKTSVRIAKEVWQHTAEIYKELRC